MIMKYYSKINSVQWWPIKILMFDHHLCGMSSVKNTERKKQNEMFIEVCHGQEIIDYIVYIETIQIFFVLRFLWVCHNYYGMHIIYGWDATIAPHRNDNQNGKQKKLTKFEFNQRLSIRNSNWTLNMENYALNRWSNWNLFAIGSLSTFPFPISHFTASAQWAHMLFQCPVSCVTIYSMNPSQDDV